MPPKPSLPLRDGRLGSSSSHIGSSQHHVEPYYSNEDIRLLHEIVATGEEILPTLPERDRLATNALFQAAEQVLPAHGYDPDHAPSNISRLIFKIGGLRSEGSLMDKFGAVLESMGINIEIVDSSEHHQPDSSSVRSTTSAGVDQTGTFSLSPRFDARRRRNSDSAAPTAPLVDLGNVPTTFNGRTRSASFGSQYGVELPDFRAAGDENRPPRHNVRASEAKANRLQGDVVGRLGTRPRPSPQLLALEDDTDDGFPYRRHGREDYLVSESAHIDEYAPADGYEAQVDHDYDLPELESVPGEYVGSSDTMAQTSDELPAEPVLTGEDRDLMEGDIQDFRNHIAPRQAATTLSKWRDEARNAAQRHQHQAARAATHDRLFALTEAMTAWRDTAMSTRRERLASMGPIRDHGADAEMERRASRLYDWVILSKAFAHWFRSSQDEVERTAIARRYILRRRYFGTWRSHQVDVEAEVQAFRLRTLLRIWKRAAIHHEVQENVAVQRYCHDLAKHVFRTWWDEYRTQLAEDFRSYHLRANCILVWQAETKRVVRGYEKSLFEDERFLLGEAISAWVEKVVAFRSIEFGCTQQRVVARLQGALEEWRTMARLNKTLREVVNDNSLRTQRQVIDLWRTQAAEADQTAVLSKKSFLQGFIAHWANEGKLRSYDSQKQRELKLEILSHWRMDRKLICYQRLCEQRTKERLLAKLRAAAANGQAEEVAMLHTATLIAERREKSLILGTWRQRTIANLNQQDMALDRHYLFAASSYLTRWYEAAREEDVRIADLETFAARGAYYVATSSVLRSWVDVTKRMRKDRLTRSYHTLRRRHKMKVAVQCLSRWRAAIHDSHSRSYQADHMYGGYLRVQLADCVRLWRNATDTVQVMRDVAQTADLEVWWGKWSRRANDLQETELDAGDYANEQTLSRCWRTWEYAMLQNKGRQHVVATLQDNNDRKLCRQVLSDWSQKAAPGVLADLRSSVASRRSVRYGNVRAVDTSRFGTTGSPPSSQPPVVQLPQIEEDLSNIYAVNARRQFGRASEPGRNPFTSGAKELSACLPQRPRGFSKHDATPVTAGPGLQPPISSFPASAGIPATGLASLDTQRPPTQQPHLQETPYSQRRPKQEFDEDEISFHPSEANDYPATFMSTPTRWTGIARSLSSGPNRTQQPPQSASFRRPATVVPTTAATTTPSALLDTPYERALRREYGGSEVLGSERRSAMAAARMVATPKVTFADIREESGEGTYHEE